MRILQVLHDSLAHRVGGAEGYVHALSKELAKKHEVHLFFRGPLEKNAGSDLSESGVYDGLPFTAFDNKYSRLDRAWRIERAFDSLLRQFRPEVVHFHHLIGLSMNLVSLARRHSAAIVLTLHDHWLMCLRRFLVRDSWELCDGPGLIRCWACLSRIPKFFPRRHANLFARITGMELRPLLAYSPLRLWWRRHKVSRIFSDVGVIVSPSRHLRDRFVREFRLSEEKVIFSAYGFDHEGFDDVRTEPGKRLRVGFVGTLGFHKGVNVLLDAFRHLPDADLVLFGSVTQHFRAYLEGHSWPNVFFKGEVDPTEKRKIYSQMDLLVLPSVCRENSPLAIQEAFMAGLPVIASDIAGVAELVTDRENGLLFRAGDAGHLRERLRAVIDHPELLERFRQRIPAVKTIQENAEEMISLYERIRYETRHS